ncbi:hypothetical protein PMIN02_000282 [Paraphaeosphaeria minitans]|uniref:Uncharacterized protein n=1 Tax=Paraphaeosphaeria minitans TaxID=565426 RepID=A0A9P6KMX8_9PLEO|nr:hypothetical protein PMIN01_10090 [Paraphaeosphaeria minitans]
MAQDRPRAHERGQEHLEASKGSLVGQLSELDHGLPLSAQRPGSFMKYTNERYPQLEQRWTSPQPGLTKEVSDEATSDMPGSLIGERKIGLKLPPPLVPLLGGENMPRLHGSAHERFSPANTNNWNDIPDEMLKPIPQGTKPQSKAEAIHRRKSRKRNATNRQKTMPGSSQSSPENRPPNFKDNHPAPHVVALPDTPGKFTLHRVTKLKTIPPLQKFKLKQNIGAGSSTQDHVTGLSIDDITASTPEAAGGYEQDKDESDWSDSSDIEGIEFDEILNASRATSGHDSRLKDKAENISTLKTTNDGTASINFSDETEHNTTVDDAASSTRTHLDTGDEFTDAAYNYLQAKKAAGEPMILPKDVVEKLRAQVKADEERRRETDPHYQHALVRAKVNAAQARREAEIPHEALYTQAVSVVKCTLDEEDWDLLGDFEVKGQPDEDDRSKLEMVSQSEDKVEEEIKASSDATKNTQSVVQGNTGKLGTIYGWASKAGNVFTSNKVPKDHRKDGWTLADILDEDERRARR